MGPNRVLCRPPRACPAALRPARHSAQAPTVAVRRRRLPRSPSPTATRWLPRPLPASCPCRPWFFRRRHPFFCADERGIREQLVEIELAELVELPDQDGMDVFQHTFVGPFLEPAPAGAPRGQVDRDVPPSCPIAQQPKNTLQALAVIDPRSAALEVRCVLRK